MNTFVKYGSLTALRAAVFISGAQAADVVHNQEATSAPIAESAVANRVNNTREAMDGYRMVIEA